MITLKCGICGELLKKGDTIYEQIEAVYQGGDETYPVHVISRWCLDCESEMQRTVEDNWNKIEQREKVVARKRKRC